MRRTYASLAIAAGSDVKTLQNAMRHKESTVTLNIYARFWTDRMDVVSDAMTRAGAAAVNEGESGTGRFPG